MRGSIARWSVRAKLIPGADRFLLKPSMADEQGVAIMKGTVRFVFDRVHDVYFAYPSWKIETAEDCQIWTQQNVDFFRPLARRVDVIAVLDKLVIGPRVGELWGRCSADLQQRFVRHCVRIGGDRRLSTFYATSATRHGVSSLEAATVPAALKMILAMRREATPQEIPALRAVAR